MFDRISRPSRTTAAEVSSQEVSMPRMSINSRMVCRPRVRRARRQCRSLLAGSRFRGREGALVGGEAGVDLDAFDDVDRALQLHIIHRLRLLLLLFLVL